MKNRLFIIYFSIGIIILIILFTLLLLYTGSAFVLKNIHIIGNKVLSSNSIINMSGLNYGNALIKIDTNSIEDRLKLNPLITKAKIDLVFPDSISINIEESTPIILLIINEKAYLLDKNAIVMEITDKTYENERFIRVEFLDEVNSTYNVKDKVEIPYIAKLVKILNNNMDKYKFIRDIKKIYITSNGEFIFKFKTIYTEFIFNISMNSDLLTKSNILFNYIKNRNNFRTKSIVISEDFIIGKE